MVMRTPNLGTFMVQRTRVCEQWDALDTCCVLRLCCMCVGGLSRLRVLSIAEVEVVIHSSCVRHSCTVMLCHVGPVWWCAVPHLLRHTRPSSPFPARSRLP